MSALRKPLPDGRWHLQHGPIDLIVSASGDARATAQAHERCWQRFVPILDELVAELSVLRRRIDLSRPEVPAGAVARRMVSACTPFAERFITPMAAVAGAVADELIGSFAVKGVSRAAINNGGDIALMLAGNESFRIGIAREDGTLAGRFDIGPADPVRGIATSGWRGRSQSLGIADRVTVLAASAALADAAATMIANAVNLDCDAVVRKPASMVKDDSDLLDLAVTVAVGPLSQGQVRAALLQGEALARSLVDRGLITAAALFLQDQCRLVQCACAGPMAPTQRAMAALATTLYPIAA